MGDSAFSGDILFGTELAALVEFHSKLSVINTGHNFNEGQLSPQPRHRSKLTNIPSSLV
jgi:hypothetical protein